MGMSGNWVRSIWPNLGLKRDDSLIYGLVVYQNPVLRGGGSNAAREISRGVNDAVSTAVTSTNYFSKANLYANSRLPLNLPPLKLYVIPIGRYKLILAINLDTDISQLTPSCALQRNIQNECMPGHQEMSGILKLTRTGGWEPKR